MLNITNANASCSGARLEKHTEFIPKKPFRLFTLPKSGTHLTEKILKNLGYTKFGPPHHFYYRHRNSFQNLPENTSYIAQIRDPRDIMISLVHHIDTRFRSKLSGSPEFAQDRNLTATKEEMVNWLEKKSFDEKLMDAICCNNSVGYNFKWAIKEQFLEAKRLFSLKKWPQNILLIRFEDLADTSSEASRYKQAKTIQKIAKHVNIPISLKHSQEILGKVWGHSKTYHDAKIDKWKTMFKKKHFVEFKKRWDPFLYLFGYEKEKNWDAPFLVGKSVNQSAS